MTTLTGLSVWLQGRFRFRTSTRLDASGITVSSIAFEDQISWDDLARIDGARTGGLARAIGRDGRRLPLLGLPSSVVAQLQEWIDQQTGARSGLRGPGPDR